MATLYVRTAIFNSEGLIDRIDLVGIEEEAFYSECKKLEPYLIALEVETVRSYDNSDDERVVSSSSSSDRVIYRELNPRENSEYMLMQNGEIVGVVFIVRNGRHKYGRAFTFDGKLNQKMRLGYVASHSSQFEYVNKVSLVERGVDKVPETAREIDFEQNEMFPNL